jgi:hypothetical protein
MLSDLGQRILLITARRGYTGADREVFFHFLRGIKYKEMEKEVLALENEDLISIEWVGPSNFTVSITAKGVEMAKSMEEGVWHKSVEALEQLGRENHHQRSILEEEGEHTYIMEDKFGVEEVGALPTDILDTLDDQIRSERTSASDSVLDGVGVPAVDQNQEGEEIDGEGEVVERRISGELDTYESEDGREIYLELGEGVSEDRIATTRASHVKKRVKERRISGELDTPDFDDEDALPMEENIDHYNEMVDSISEYQLSSVKNDGKYSMIPEKMEEEAPPESVEEELEEETEEAQMEQEIVYEEEAPLVESEDEIYNQIVETISLDRPDPEPKENVTMEVSDKLICTWETYRYCPLKMKNKDKKKFKVTPSQCTVCQLVEIKQLLKKRID